MVLNTVKCNHLTPLGLKGLMQINDYTTRLNNVMFFLHLRQHAHSTPVRRLFGRNTHLSSRDAVIIYRHINIHEHEIKSQNLALNLSVSCLFCFYKYYSTKTLPEAL